MMGNYDVASLSVSLAAGLACGFLNTVASSGSAVSLPVLMWIGLHAVDANATNRIPVLIGSLTATIDLARHHKIPWGIALRAVMPVTIGAAFGALFAEVIPSHDLRLVVTAAIVVALVLILTKLKDILRTAEVRETQFRWQEVCWFLLIGFWLGFIVLDAATYLLLALVLSVGLPLAEANAAKCFLTVPTTAVAMLIFASHGSIDWRLGAVLGVGSIIGGLLGSRLAVSEQARRWIVGLLIFVIVGELIQLSIRYCFDFNG
jgi:uncharacterized membrane protein YfcA